MKIAAALMVGFVLSGCASIMPTDPFLPVSMPSQRASAGAARLSCSKIPIGPFGLQEAIEIALANNPEVAATRWYAIEARARQKQASGERLPKLDVVSSYRRHLDEQRLLPSGEPGEPVVLSRDILSGDLVLSLPLFTGGRLINQVEAADLLHQAATHRLARSREELVFNVSSVFFSILAQRRVIESLKFSLETLDEHVKRVNALVAAQKAAKVDRMRTEVRLADVQQQLVREKNILAVKKRILANFLGVKGDIDKILLRGELEVYEDSTVPDLGSALSKAWKERDDYLAEKSALEAKARKLDAARAGNWPIVSVQGSYGGRWAAGPTTGTANEFDDKGSIALGIEVPIFDGGRVDAEIWEHRAGLAAAQERLRKLELRIRLEVETALSNVKSSMKRIQAIRKSIAQAQESLRIEREKYDLGKGAIVDVLDAQAALLETETNWFRVLAELRTALAQLKLAMGEE